MRQLDSDRSSRNVKSLQILGWSVAVATFSLMIGCPSGSSPSSGTVVHEKTGTAGQGVLLDTGEDAAGDPSPLTYEWSQTGGPAVDLENANGQQWAFVPPESGDYEFTVSVIDARGNSRVLVIRVSVSELQSNNLQVSAGSNAVIALGGSANLVAIASGGQPPYSLVWTPADGLTDPASATPSASPAATTEYTVTVTDSSGQTATDKVLVSVATPSELQVNASEDKIIAPGQLTNLSAVATGGQPPYAFVWTPAGGLNDPASATPSASPTVTTEYTVSVTDAAGSMASDKVLVTLATVVTGPIWTPTVWTLANSPYLVSGSFQIPEGITLTIEPGVEVKYVDDAQIYIRGGIIANGSVTSHITFGGSNSSSVSPATFIKFEGANLSDSQLSYVDMSHSVRAIRVGEESEHQQKPKNSGTLTVSHGTFDSTEVRTDGYQTSARLVLTDCSLTSCSVFGEYPRSEPIEIDNSTVKECHITSDSYNYGISLKGCTVSSTRFQMGCCEANIAVISSSLTGCLFENGEGSPVMGPLTLRGCQCTDVGVWLPYAAVDISDSSFLYDSSYSPVFTARFGALASLPWAKITLGVGTIEYSTFAGDGQGSAIEARGYNDYLPLPPVTIDHCTIRQNEIGILLNGGASTCSITNSNLDSNSQTAVDNRRVGDIAATNDYWGTDTAAQIPGVIHDYFDDIMLGKVLFNPIASSSNADAQPRP